MAAKASWPTMAATGRPEANWLAASPMFSQA
jgi:hypothetical protein